MDVIADKNIAFKGSINAQAKPPAHAIADAIEVTVAPGGFLVRLRTGPNMDRDMFVLATSFDMLSAPVRPQKTYTTARETSCLQPSP